MKISTAIAVGIACAGIAACGGGNDEAANESLEVNTMTVDNLTTDMNMDMNMTDMNMDMNADLNADLNATTNMDANATTNTY